MMSTPTNPHTSTMPPISTFLRTDNSDTLNGLKSQQFMF